MKIILVLALVLVLTGIAGSVVSFVRTTHTDGLDESFYTRGGMMSDSFYTRSGMINDSFYIRSGKVYDYQGFCYNEQYEDDSENCPIVVLPIR
ncbi:MAG: hypothetical protein J7L77_01480 [Clostridiales bacterium]|nr:hypothetical protein [Clostridiales bacterium]